jgi:hypothetical protein
MNDIWEADSMPSIWKLANIIPSFTISAIHITKTGVCINPIFFYLKFNLVFFFLGFSLNVAKSQVQQQVNNRTVKQPLN